MDRRTRYLCVSSYWNNHTACQLASRCATAASQLAACAVCQPPGAALHLPFATLQAAVTLKEAAVREWVLTPPDDRRRLRSYLLHAIVG